MLELVELHVDMARPVSRDTTIGHHPRLLHIRYNRTVGGTTMFHTLQPARPQVQQSQPQNAHYQHQIRHNPTEAQPAQLMTAPRSQTEAMPPTRTPPMPSVPLQPVYNPATTHPVFFMNSFRKPPFPLPLDAGLNPVATGYVFARDGMATKTKL
ncbi:hypothetical protein CLAFUW4_12163 [Fulvia fulva]|uniref:Uncharacterized protein n=1 Tax=Passalora fulva TaxID=5499 RepID=A0A9Q8PE57_PASFU|nr:uncharacterized protein CLAFUR5_11200 [Fulvia fulva]KAK4617771.1 hypothetical protein CLAFUR4_12168 [Fulvia fulva]KAK4618604.1 hypothetical protein CLAFUR0_12179 [Fulvia fulva]UJO20805.1 hypothetical protein CLAFUR5_11200 [Fulvia fulva]WPV18549.1 hypothetical protein CLAFUW4_12163 [Fulvia fulva]WPV32919.1 hypothetical protein CLAFUW7_12170 [Fulvia fulva]